MNLHKYLSHFCDINTADSDTQMGVLLIMSLYFIVKSDEDISTYPSYLYSNMTDMTNTPRAIFNGLCNTSAKPNEAFKPASVASKYVSGKVGKDISIYYNPDTKQVIVNIGTVDNPSLTLKKSFIALGEILPTVLTWLKIKPKKGDDDYEILSLFKQGKYDSVTSLIMPRLDALLKPLYLRNLKTTMCTFQEKRRQSKLTDLKNYEEQIRADINGYLTYLKNKEKERQDIIFDISRLEEQPIEDDNTLYKLFSSYKCLDVIDYNSREVSYSITTPIEFFDSDIFDRMIKRKSGWCYMFESKYLNLLKVLFSEEYGYVMQLYTTSFWVLGLEGTVDIRYDAQNEPICQDIIKHSGLIGHPHLWFYNCLGDNASVIAERVNEGDVAGAIDQSIAANRNLYFNDSVVCSKLMSELATTDAKPIKYQDKFLSIAEAMDKAEEIVNG